jgi:GT2 family glycosyltransferase
MLVRREVFDALGGFDEEFWNGHEDVDFCLGAGELGWDILYEPTSVLVHHESISGPERFRKTNENVRRLNARWGKRIVAECFVVKAPNTQRAHPRVQYLYRAERLKPAA